VRTVYLGTSDFAVDVLQPLASSPHTPALVVTPPDRPRGRGRKTASPPAAVAARELGLPVLQVETVNEPTAFAAIEEASPEAIVVCAFGQLIREPLLSRWLMLNVHPSLVPRWRGAAPIERTLMAGDEETGVTILRVTAGLDSGPVAARETLAVDPSDTRATLGKRLSTAGVRLLIDALDRAEAGALEFTDQGEDGVIYADKIDAAERRLDPQRPAAELARVVRALTPGVGAYVELDGGERLGIEDARAVADRAAPGAVDASNGRLLIGTADGALELLSVKPAGRRAMPVADYLRGHTPAGRIAR
jgi:methionyl-tRNA formyltransferase